MKNDFVSVVVPVYKVEQYLERCLESLLKQTYSNYEIVLVDDGSPDRSGEICDKYAEKNVNIHVVHQKNKGLSEARNVGVKHSQGDIVVFVDSDDMVEDNYIEELVRLINKYDADIAVVQFLAIDEGKTKEIEKKRKEEHNEYCISANQAMKELFYSKNIGVTAWAKAYRRKIVEQILFPSHIKNNEDNATTYKMIDCAEKIAVSNEQLYIYIKRPQSITTKHRDIFYLSTVTDIYTEMVEYLEKKYSDLTIYAVKDFLDVQFYNLSYLEWNETKTKIEFDRICKIARKYFFKAMAKNDISMRSKCNMTLICLGYKVTILAEKGLQILKSRRNT